MTLCTLNGREKLMWPQTYEDLLSYPTYCGQNQSEIHSRENKSEHIAVNKNREYVRQIKVDGDILPNDYVEERRADYLVLNETKKTAYIIELKGSHIKSAFVQVENTDQKLKNALKDFKIHWRIVCGSRTTNLKTNEIQRYQRQHQQLILKRNIIKEEI